MQAIQVAKSGK